MPPILAVLLVLALTEVLPSRYLLVGQWFPFVLMFAGVLAMLAVWAAPTRVVLHRIERVTIIAIAAIGCVSDILIMVRLVGDMLGSKHGYGSIELLETATSLWVVNVLIFALLYWQTDRTNSNAAQVDFRFGEEEPAHDGSAAWQPHFVDYLYLAFVASTAFAPPDYAKPVSRRAKLMLMLQSAISLTTLFLIASRAIATLS